MPYLFSEYAGRSLPEYPLTVDEYVYRLDNKLLTPFTASFGFKTYVETEPLHSPGLLDPDKYIELFRQHWNPAVAELANKLDVTPEFVHSLIAPKGAKFVKLQPVPTKAKAIGTQNNFTVSIKEALRQSAVQGTYVVVNTMSVQRQALKANALATVSEDGATANATDAKPQPTDRKAAKLNMLKRMRPPPFTHCWTFWHAKYVAPGTDANLSSTYENRLTIMYAEIHDIKEFYQIYNHTPCENLRQRDSFHLFKRGVKPVWEDPRNITGGCWTFRVPKEKSTEFWMLLQVLAVGEGFDDVVDRSTSSPPLSLFTHPLYYL